MLCCCVLTVRKPVLPSPLFSLYRRAQLLCSQDKGPFLKVMENVTETPDTLAAVVLVAWVQVQCLF